MKLKSFLLYSLCLLFMASCGGSDDGSDSDDMSKGNYEIVNGKKFIDLGLPSHTLWAETNVGANKIEDVGDYYAWGECETKDYYWEDNYKWNNVKYPSDNLASSDDVATKKWGNGIRIPTSEEAKELLENCTFTWTTYKGVKGYSVKGKNNNSIFLPAGGYKNKDNRRLFGLVCEYWTSTRKIRTYLIDLDSRYMGTEYEFRVSGNNDYNGLLVRPVTVKK